MDSGDGTGGPFHELCKHGKQNAGQPSPAALLVHAPTANETARMLELMAQYEDVPMDLADASLVALAETLNLKRIFTLDKDFYIYRINGKDAFAVIP